jgi:DNA-directed RNA polymerase subunit RPC12/RpoP
MGPKIIDITNQVQFYTNDDECLPIVECACGHAFDPWEFVLSVYRDDPRECPNCGRKMFFQNEITVYQVIEEGVDE